MGSVYLGHSSAYVFFTISISRSHVVAQLERGRKPWVPDKADLTPVVEREADRWPGPAEQELDSVTLELGSHHTSSCFLCTSVLLLRPLAVPHFFISFPTLDTLPPCHFSYVFHPLADPTSLVSVSHSFSSAPFVTLAAFICHELCTHPSIVLKN